MKKVLPYMNTLIKNQDKIMASMPEPKDEKEGEMMNKMKGLMQMIGGGVGGRK